MAEIYGIYRQHLERLLANTALELFKITGSAAYRIPIKRTKPELFVFVGTKEDIKKLLD